VSGKVFNNNDNTEYAVLRIVEFSVAIENASLMIPPMDAAFQIALCINVSIIIISGADGAP
jgi:hypothetical protein